MRKELEIGTRVRVTLAGDAPREGEVIGWGPTDLWVDPATGKTFVDKAEGRQPTKVTCGMVLLSDGAITYTCLAQDIRVLEGPAEEEPEETPDVPLEESVLQQLQELQDWAAKVRAKVVSGETHPREVILTASVGSPEVGGVRLFLDHDPYRGLGYAEALIDSYNEMRQGRATKWAEGGKS